MIETIVVTNDDKYYHNFLSENNYQGNTILSIQSSKISGIEKEVFEDITIVKSGTKGIGMNRNIGLYSAKKAICVCADDDMIFYDNYLAIVEDAYKKLPKADIIIFDLDGARDLGMKGNRPSRVRWYNFMRFGGARFSYKRASILKHGISFNPYFGASIFGSGEDTLFLSESLKKGLVIYHYPEALAKIKKDRESTWFKGFDKKYYFDKGALFYAISPMFYRVLLLRHVIKTIGKSKSLSLISAYRAGLDGVSFYKNL